MTREEALRLATKLVCRKVDKIDKIIESVVQKGSIPCESLLEEKQKYEEAYSTLIKQSIPVGVHTAALEYAREQCEFNSRANLPDICQFCCNSMVMDFKAGAKWMAGHGETAEVGYWNQRGLSLLLDKPLEKLGYKEGDKVIVQIRKK